MSGATQFEHPLQTAAPRLRIITGKGGVGKTVVSTAIAMAEVRRHRRVLLAEINGRDSVARLLEVQPIGSQLREITEYLYAVDVNPHDAMHEYAMLALRFESVYRAVFDNRFVRRFLRLVPSLSEVIMLGKIGYHETQYDEHRPRFDVIIVDAPATGHAIALLRAAGVVQRTVPAGPMRDHAHEIHTLLTDPIKTRLHIVTTPDEMAITEALELARTATEDIGIRLSTTFVNQSIDLLSPDALATLEERAAQIRDDPEPARLVAALRERQERCNEADRQIQRLPAQLLGNVCRLPRLVGDVFGAEQVQLLAQHVELSLGQGDSGS